MAVPPAGSLLCAAQRALPAHPTSIPAGRVFSRHSCRTDAPQEVGMFVGRAGRHTGRVSRALTLQRVRRDIEVLAHAGLDTATFLGEVYESLQRAVPSTAACVATVDPATELATGAFKFGELAGRDDSDELWALLEYGDVEPTSYVELSRSGVAAVGMHVLTSGEVQRSRRVRELVQSTLGCTDELRVLASAEGRLWGAVPMFRYEPRVTYDTEDLGF